MTVAQALALRVLIEGGQARRFRPATWRRLIAAGLAARADHTIVATPAGVALHGESA